MKTTIYHNPQCSKSRSAVALLETHGIEFDVVKYLEHAPTERELTKIVKMLGCKPEQIVRKKEKLFKELGLDNKQLSDSEWIATLAAHPRLIERPIVVHEGHAAIGRPTENIETLLKM